MQCTVVIYGDRFAVGPTDTMTHPSREQLTSNFTCNRMDLTPAAPQPTLQQRGKYYLTSGAQQYQRSAHWREDWSGYTSLQDNTPTKKRGETKILKGGTAAEQKQETPPHIFGCSGKPKVEAAKPTPSILGDLKKTSAVNHRARECTFQIPLHVGAKRDLTSAGCAQAGYREDRLGRARKQSTDTMADFDTWGTSLVLEATPGSEAAYSVG